MVSGGGSGLQGLMLRAIMGLGRLRCDRTVLYLLWQQAQKRQPLTTAGSQWGCRLHELIIWPWVYAKGSSRAARGRRQDFKPGHHSQRPLAAAAAGRRGRRRDTRTCARANVAAQQIMHYAVKQTKAARPPALARLPAPSHTKGSACALHAPTCELRNFWASATAFSVVRLARQGE